ncbi:hypothetical protein GCM10008969_42700 [Pseudomonas veronii subsp. inensis]
MPEKYQKNKNSQPRPAQSKPFADVVLRLNIAIQCSNPVSHLLDTHNCTRAQASLVWDGPRAREYREVDVKNL